LNDLATIAQRARSAYVRRIAGESSGVPWWTAVIVTAGSTRQADRYSDEIHRRREQEKVPPGVLYLVVPDLGDQRMGSGGATLNALRALGEQASLESWWANQRVLMIHSGGDSRRLPQYSLIGKLFTALPVKTPWGEVSTVFDETLALSSSWVERLPCGLLVASGDVVLTFDAGGLRWDRPGVTGVAIRQPVEVGSGHGVYIADERGRVYSFLQKPSAAQVRAAGGLLDNDEVALDSGLLRFDHALAARLAELGGGLLRAATPPVLDLYEHVTLALTGQWTPAPDAAPICRQLWETLRGSPFWCCLVRGDFTHVGTTTSFRRLITEETNFTRLYEVQQRLGTVSPPGLRSAGVIIDSALAGGGELGPGALAIECDLEHTVRAARGAILHGLADLPTPVEAPEDTVLHQVPVILPDGRRGVVIRAYGVADDPKLTVASGRATWFGRPILEALAALGLEAAAVWPGFPPEARTLWNALLFPFGAIEEAWACARWMTGTAGEFSAAQWATFEKLSLETSARWADSQALAAARTRRLHANWQLTAVSLAKSGADIRPLLAHAPGIRPLAGTGRSLATHATSLRPVSPTEAASHYFQASLLLGQAGLAEEAGQAREAAFACVELAVDRGMCGNPFASTLHQWRHQAVTVSAPPRIDLGGGWSDTPPFCLDWGGTVLNIAVAFGDDYPIRTAIRRLDEPLVRCISEEGGEVAEYRSTQEIFAPPKPGDPFAIPRAALQMTEIVRPEESLGALLDRCGGGLEIRMGVHLPMGSGLGTSSILAATLLRALAEMLGVALTDHALSDQVMRLEQRMTTGGGWQDQAGGIFPGAKLVTSGPGLRQRLRVEPIGWTLERQAEFAQRFLLYYTGIRRIAKDLLRQVVGSYLAREVATVQVLHSIKTLAVEMAYAMREGTWDYLGRLLDRHWQLNQILDPHTTNAPINGLLEELRPFLAGAKLAGAGGGGFLLLLARDPQAAAALKVHLSSLGGALPGALYPFQIAHDGLRVEVFG
jgi:fucokinase